MLPLRRITIYLPPTIILVGIVAFWEASVDYLGVPTYEVSPPSIVVPYMVTHVNVFLLHSYYTLVETLGGFFLGTLLGLVTAILIVYSAMLRTAVYPLLVASQVIPKIAIAPLFLIILGYGVDSKIAISALVCFFPVVLSSELGLISVEPEMIDLARSLNASQMDILFRVRLRHALPYFFSGLLTGSTLAVVGAVVGEFLGGNYGLGYLVVSGLATANYPIVWGSLIWLLVIGVVIFVALLAVERISIRWYYLERKTK